MRADMFKVIVERPCWGASHATSVKLRKDKDPHEHIGLKRHAKEQATHTKFLNENLAPLVRCIQRQVGRRWDDVFSASDIAITPLSYSGDVSDVMQPGIEVTVDEAIINSISDKSGIGVCGEHRGGGTGVAMLATQPGAAAAGAVSIISSRLILSMTGMGSTGVISTALPQSGIQHLGSSVTISGQASAEAS